MIACLLPNVTSITLKAGSHWIRYPQRADLYNIKAEDIDRHIRCNLTKQDPLQSLTTVQVQFEPENPEFRVVQGRDFTSLSVFMPVLGNASNLTHVRSYGFDVCWTDLPDTTVSLECRGPFTETPLSIPQGNLKLRHLKLTVLPLEPLSMVRRLDLRDLCWNLGRCAPELEYSRCYCLQGNA